MAQKDVLKSFLGPANNYQILRGVILNAKLSTGRENYLTVQAVMVISSMKMSHQYFIL